MSLVAPLGRHLLADLHDADASLLRDVSAIESALLVAAEAAGATVVGHAFHHFGEGQGVTGVVLLKESHISIHTWPERRFAALDVFMCGTAEPQKAVDSIARAIGVRTVQVHDVPRGR